MADIIDLFEAALIISAYVSFLAAGIDQLALVGMAFLPRSHVNAGFGPTLRDRWSGSDDRCASVLVEQFCMAHGAAKSSDFNRTCL